MKRSLFFLVALLVASLVWSASVRAAETPRRGGVLLAAIAADAPDRKSVV